MAGILAGTPGVSLTPSAQKVAIPDNYITDFNFLNQFLPDTYEQEFERYGNRSIASFLRMVGAELPTNSDLIKWAEQGRLHTKYTNVIPSSAAGSDTATFTMPTTSPATLCNFRVNQTVFLSSQTVSANSGKAVISAVAADGSTFTVKFYNAAGSPFTITTELVTAFVYGSEFQKGTTGMVGSLEAQDVFFDVKPIIIN